MLSSSIQATLIGRYGQSDYGKSKLAGEELFLNMAKNAGQKYWCIVSRTFLENGVDRITTVPLPHFATTSQTIFLFR